MTLDQLISTLQEARQLNGNMIVYGMESGTEYREIEINVPDSTAVYIELYKD